MAKFESFELPSRDVMSAGVKSESVGDLLTRTHALLCAFIGALSSRIYEILVSEEESEIKDALSLILEMDASYGYYPLKKLIVGDAPSSSYFLRIGDDPNHTFLNSLIEEKERKKKKGTKEKERKLSGLRKELAKEETKLEPKDPTYLELKRKVTAYDKLGKAGKSAFPEFERWFKEKTKGGFGLSSAYGELIITDALAYVSHHIKLKADYDKEKREHEEELEKFKKTNDAQALIKACERLKEGPKSWIEIVQFPEFVNWRVSTLKPRYPEIDIDHQDWASAFRKMNPEFEEFLKCKYEYIRLSEFRKKAPTWRPVNWNEGRTKEERKGRRFPFFNLKYFCDGHGLVPVESKNGVNATIDLRLLWVSDLSFICAKLGIPTSGFQEMEKKELFRFSLTPDSRLQKGLRLPEKGAKSKSQIFFELQDPKSGERIVRDFTGLRFRESNGIWEAQLTFKPSVGAAFDFEDVIKAYDEGLPAPFLPGTLISGFVYTATSKYIPRKNAAGWFTTFGVKEDGKLECLKDTAVTPYLVSSKRNRYRRNKQAGQKSSGGISYGLAKLVTIEHLNAIKRQIYLNLKLSGRKKTSHGYQANPGDNRKLWDKYNNCAETFRQQLSAQVLRLALKVEDRLLPQGGLTEGDVARPRKIAAWYEKYPEAKHLLVVPHPMGASHGPSKGNKENKLLHTIGVAEIYRLVLTKACYARISCMPITKADMWITNPLTGKPMEDTKEGLVKLIDDAMNEHFMERGKIGTTNIVMRLFDPVSKEKKSQRKKKAARKEKKTTNS